MAAESVQRGRQNARTWRRIRLQAPLALQAGGAAARHPLRRHLYLSRVVVALCPLASDQWGCYRSLGIQGQQHGAQRRRSRLTTRRLGTEEAEARCLLVLCLHLQLRTKGAV